MTKPTIRRAQLISPFGVGALHEVDGQSFFIRGTHRWPGGRNLKTINLPSLSGQIWGVSTFKKVEKAISVSRFPRWHFCSSCRRMHNWTYQRDIPQEQGGPSPRPHCDNPSCKNHPLVPMRFVAVCDMGHLDEIDWYSWAHRRAQLAETGACERGAAKLSFVVTGRRGGDFDSMAIECSCGARSTLAGISDRPLPQRCRGYQPGEQPQGCRSPEGQDGATAMWMEPRGSTALHHPLIISALDIARGTSEGALEEILGVDRMFQSHVTVARRMVEKGIQPQNGLRTIFFDEVAEIAEEKGLTAEDAWMAFEQLVRGDEDDQGEGGQDLSQRAILQSEFPVLSSPTGFDGPTLVCRPSRLSRQYGLDRLFEKVVQVEKLREVRIFRGFQRRDVSDEHAVIPPDLGVGSVTWLPGIEVSGEGVFLEFNTRALSDWLSENRALIEGFTSAQLVHAEQQGLPSRMGFNASPVFILAHSLAHVLINQLSFDCGYSSTSLRERIYCGPDDTPSAGVLIYTADSDSEGSMGGLVEMGDPDLISGVVYRAIAKSQWCSGDPVCRELESQGLGGVNRAACHACCLVAETSCVYANALLNRILLSGEGRTNGRGVVEPRGFFAPLLGD